MYMVMLLEENECFFCQRLYWSLIYLLRHTDHDAAIYPFLGMEYMDIFFK